MGGTIISYWYKTRLFIVIFLLTFVSLSPVVVNGQETTVQPEVTTTEEPIPPPKYVYNKETGLWENGVYAWDPNTNKTTPMQPVDYSYNPETEQWDTTKWKSDNSGVYSPNTASQPRTSTVPTDILKSGEQPSYETESSRALITTPQSTNEVKDSDSNEYFFDGYYNVTISGSIQSRALSGDALVSGNTIGGNATTGSALSYASLLNIVQASFGGTPAYYSTNIQGGHVGDLVIDPDNLAVADHQSNPELKVTHAQDLTIQNDVKLTAISGDATVGGNTEGGDATSGDAQVAMTIMNLINSSIATDQSFIGVLNILGDFEGDVLLASDLMESLLASNVPTSEIMFNNPTNVSVKSDINITAENNIELNAESGDAVVSGNTQGGDATSGSASTTLTVFNLIGQQIVAENALLVFVNVGGEWVGFITNAPAGSTVALLGSGGEYSLPYEQLDYDVRSDYTIVNDVQLNATSGDATVTHNTLGGDAKSGDAQVAANVMNVVNSNLLFNSWFGALFINVFGDWFGSFGTDTAYGGFSQGIPEGIGGEEESHGSSSSRNGMVSGRVLVANVVKTANGGYQVLSSVSGSSWEGFTSADVAPPVENEDTETVVLADNEQPLVQNSLEVGNRQTSGTFSWRLMGLVVLAGSTVLYTFRREQPQNN